MSALQGADSTSITIPVSAGQYHVLAGQMAVHGRPDVVHKVVVGPFYVPGTWAVTGVKQRKDHTGDTYLVTLTKVAE